MFLWLAGEWIKAGSLSDVIAEALKDNRIVAVHGHGSFATGQLLEEAFNCTTHGRSLRNNVHHESMQVKPEE